jgi:hypothetical protein
MKSKSSNKNLHNANRAKNDEFYTRLEDIEVELFHYKDHFKGKVVFCNCDDPVESNFWEYFKLKFEDFGLKKLISTHFEKDKPSYKLEMTSYKKEPIKTRLKQNGDFRSEECVEILKEVDIVVTNPPFSLFREYIAQLIEYKKKFVVVGNQNATGYKEIFPLIKDNKIWLGKTYPKHFIQPDKSIKNFGNIRWFTNLRINKYQEEIILYKTYKGNENYYHKYDNYNAINIDEVKHIPKDFKGVMGVPITFLDKYNPKQFEIIKFRKGNDEKDLSIDGKCPYSRILIKKI